MDEAQAIVALRAFNRFTTRFAGALDAHYLDSDLSLTEARLLYEIAQREAPLARELQAELGLDAGYVSRILRRFQAKGWIERGRGDDARRRPISLTQAGRAAFAALDARSRGKVAPYVARLGAADRDTLVAAMATVTGLLGGGEVAGAKCPALRSHAGGMADPATPWHIRTFRTGDLSLIASRQAILYDSYGWNPAMEILQGEITTAFVRDFKPGREQCWVAERAGMMAGAVFVVDAGDDVAQLRLLHVEPWARGLGIGSALVAECVRFAREAGYAKMRLWTHTVLTSARRIYEAQGFRIVETAVHDEFGTPEQGEIWELGLTPPADPRS